VVVFRALGWIGLLSSNVIQGVLGWWRDKIIGVDLNDLQGGMGLFLFFLGPPLRHDPFRQPFKNRCDIVQHLVALTDGGAIHLDCTAYHRERQAWRSCHRGWGVLIVIGVAEAARR